MFSICALRRGLGRTRREPIHGGSAFAMWAKDGPAQPPPWHSDLTSVQSAITSAWQASLNAATQYYQKEYGFWIQVDTASGYVPGALQEGYAQPVDVVVVSIDMMPSKPSDYLPNQNPADSAIYTIGLFHTHPPQQHTSSSRRVGAGTEDNTVANGNKVVGIVRDYVPTLPDNHIPAYHPETANYYDSQFGRFRRLFP